MTARVSFRGGETCSCVAESLPILEELMILKGLISNSVDIYQLGWRTDVSQSAGTHSRGGCTDVGQYNDADLKFWRTYGWCAQRRTPAQGFIYHNHMWPNGCGHLASAARYQQNAWNNGRDGLVSNGRITGPGPKGRSTPSWEAGLAKARKDIMAIEDRIAAKVTAALAGKLNAAGSTPAETFTWAGINISDAGKKPNYWSAGHVLSWLQRAVATEGQVTALSAKVDALTALVKENQK